MNSFYLNYGSQLPDYTLTDKCIILDLDKTLICTQDKMKDLQKLGILTNPKLMELRRRVYILDLDDATTAPGSGHNDVMWGITRPHLSDFLTFCFTYFRIVAVWSAGYPKYVNSITDYIFKDIMPPHVILTRDDLNFVSEQFSKPIVEMVEKEPFLKDYMNVKNTLVIDDLSDNFIKNPDNGVLIPVYNPRSMVSDLERDDRALLQLKTWLLSDDVRLSTDVRTLNKSDIFSINTSHMVTIKSPRGINPNPILV